MAISREPSAIRLQFLKPFEEAGEGYRVLQHSGAFTLQLDGILVRLVDQDRRFGVYGVGVGFGLGFLVDSLVEGLVDLCVIEGWYMDGECGSKKELAKNDGLSLEDRQEWFKGHEKDTVYDKPLAIIHFTNFRY